MAGLSIFQSAAQGAQEEMDQHSVKIEAAKRFALGGGWSIGAAIALGAYEILRSNPHDAFPLLQSWGPKAIGCLIALYFGYDIVRAILMIGTRAVVALEVAGAALERSAEKNDRVAQENQVLTQLTSQRTDKLTTVMHDLRNQMQDSADLLRELRDQLGVRERRDVKREERDARIDQRDKDREQDRDRDRGPR